MPSGALPFEGEGLGGVVAARPAGTLPIEGIDKGVTPFSAESQP